MSISVRLRRPFVVLGVVLSILVGAATIRAAAAWTAENSPLVERAPSVQGLEAALAVERARSVALRTQLDELTTGSADLSAALDVARDRIEADAAQAAELQASLETARTKLAVLEASIREARVSSAATAAAPTAGAREEEHDDDDHGHDEDDDD